MVLPSAITLLLFLQGGHVDPHRERADIYKPAHASRPHPRFISHFSVPQVVRFGVVGLCISDNLDSLGQGLIGKDAADGLAEVPRKVGGLEADEVCAEDPVQQRLAHAEAPEDLGRGECDVHEEADGIGGGVLWVIADERGEKHEVVIVDPN